MLYNELCDYILHPTTGSNRDIFKFSFEKKSPRTLNIRHASLKIFKKIKSIQSN